MKFKKIISSILTFCMSASLVPAMSVAAEEYDVRSVIISDDFESYTAGTTPDNMTVIGSSDSVYVDTVGSSKRLWLKNENDISGVGVEYNFDAVYDQSVSIEADYLKIGNKSDGDVILGVYYGDTAVAVVQTTDGHIVYKTKSAYEIIAENYFCNKAYKITLVADLHGGEATVYVNDEEIGTYDLLDTSGYVDSLLLSSSYSPGFAADNVSVTLAEQASEITVSGDSAPVIPAYDTAEYEYKATVKNSNGSALSGVPVEWSLVGAPAGVSLLATSGESVKLSVASTASATTFTVRATISGTDIKCDYPVTTEVLQATTAEIIGWTDRVRFWDENDNTYYIDYPSYRVTAYNSPQTYKFSVKVKDQYENEVADFGEFRWELIAADGETVPEYITIDSTTGKVTVRKNPEKEQRLTIKATSRDDASVYGETTLLVSDYDTYSADKERIDATIGHVETMVNYAGDDDTPMIGDLLVRYANVPAAIAQKSDTVAYYSNAMTQSNLLRTMMNVSAVTGNDKYANRVYELYNFLMNNGVNGSSIAWGGHMTMDMGTNARHLDSFGVTHEIKSCIPYVEPMFSEKANKEYALDIDANGNEKNGGGYAGYLVRAMVAGHAGGDLQTFAFERHWNNNKHATALEDVWQTPEIFDKERQGPPQWNGGASFQIVSSGMISILLDYYRATGDENALLWAENAMASVLNATYTYYVYQDPRDPDNPEALIYPSDTDEDRRREFVDRQGNVVFLSAEPDVVYLSGKTEAVTNAVYRDPDGIAECIDMDGNPVTLTLINSWTEGFCDEEFATTKGMEEGKLDSLSTSLGYPWYQATNYNNYTGPEYGDRFYNQVIWGTEDPSDKDSWLELGYCTEEEAALMLTTYNGSRALCQTATVGEAFTTLIDTFMENGDTDKATQYILQYSKGVYNNLKLRYDFDNTWMRCYMTWMRPSYVRENGITGYEELGEFEDFEDRDERYFNIGLPYPHNGYFGNKGTVWSSKSADATMLANLAKTVKTSRDVADAIKDTDPENAELLYKRSRFIWRVLRSLCMDKWSFGDIGEDLDNLNPDLNYSTTTTGYAYILGMMEMYKATDCTEFLDMARTMANNFMRSYWSPTEQIFTTGSDYLASTSFQVLPLLLELDAMLLDREEENIVAKSTQRGDEMYDGYARTMSGRYEQIASMFLSPSTLYPNFSVKVKEVNILHDTIELSVGESMTIDYEIVPFDASSQSVTWDVKDTRIAAIDGNTNTIFGLKKGKTTIRCVSSSGLRIASKEVEVIVR